MSSDGDVLNPLLRLAVITGVETAVRHHIRKGDNLNARDGGGLTPLMIAASRKKNKVVELLLSAGADPHLFDSKGESALSLSEKNGAEDCALLLRAALAEKRNSCDDTAVLDIKSSIETPLTGSHESTPSSPVLVETKCGDESSAGQLEYGKTAYALCTSGAVGQHKESEGGAFLRVPVSADRGSSGSLNSHLDSADSINPPLKGNPALFAVDEDEFRAERNSAQIVKEMAAPDYWVLPEVVDTSIKNKASEDPSVLDSVLNPPDETSCVQGESIDCSPESDLSDTPSSWPVKELSWSFDDDVELDDWEEEPEVVAPENNVAVAEEVKSVHRLLASHKAIDTDENWEDVDTFLPVKASPVEKGSESEKNIRMLFLRAIRDGAVPESQVVGICLNDFERDEELEKCLVSVIEDLGGSVRADCDFLGPAISMLESYDEALEVTAALEYFEDLRSGWNEPLRFYQNEFKSDLLSADEEIALSQQMESSGIDALQALARWPKGIEQVLAAGSIVAKGDADVEIYSSGAEPSISEPETDVGEHEMLDGESASLGSDAFAFVNAVADLAGSVSDSTSKTFEALQALALTRGFLSELAELEDDDPAAKDFSAALERQKMARERMITCNLRLAYHLARKYILSGMPFEDLIQEANIGLIKAVERFDWRKGFRFSTYGTWWIRQQITRCIADKSRVVRVPVHMHDKIRSVEREILNLESFLGRPATVNEIAMQTETPEEQVRLILRLLQEPLSLDDCNTDRSPLVELMADPKSQDPLDVAEFNSLKSVLNNMLSGIEKRLSDVLIMRFGLQRESMTLEEIGPYYGVTRERIRQIESKALKKLSHPSHTEELSEFIEINKRKYLDEEK